jgi:hypothetical protein
MDAANAVGFKNFMAMLLFTNRMLLFYFFIKALHGDD